VLVIGPAWIGDMVMAQCLLQTLKSREDNPAITLAAPAATARLAHRMPEVDKIIETPFQHGRLQLADRLRIGRSLRGHRFDQAIILPGSLKAALLPFFAKAAIRTGYRGEPRWGLINDPRTRPTTKEDPMAARFVQLAFAADAATVSSYPDPRLATHPENVERVFQRIGRDVPSAPVIALCPGAEFGPAKRWPEAHFAAVADHFLAQGWQIWLLGGKSDQAVAKNIIGKSTGPEQCVDLTGKTSIEDAIDLLAHARAAVSNDSGLMHVAAATGTPIVGIFGSSSELHTPPLGLLTDTVSQALDCRPCFARKCPLGHTQCLETLEPDRVIASLSALIQKTTH